MATTNPKSPSSEPSDNECSICHELFTVPKLLPCGHVLCRHCLVTWLQSQPQAHCPLCRCPVVEPRKAPAVSNTWDVVADGFPTDLAMEELVEAERLLKKDHQCVVCEDVAATSLCLDCRDLMCATCKKAHKKFSPSKHHRVEDLSCLTADQLTSQQPSPCPAHPDKACELYCPSHDVTFCHVCAASRHRGCPDVTDLQQKAETSRAKLQELATKLTEAEKKLNQEINKLDQRLQDKEKKTKASLAELKVVCGRLKSAIDAYYVSEEQRVEEDRSDISKKANDHKACLLQRRGRVTSERGAIERVQGMKKHDAITTMTTVMDERVSKLDLTITHLPYDIRDRLDHDFDISSEDSVKRNRQSMTKLVASTFTVDSRKQAPTWRFHTNRGKKIILSKDYMVAEKEGGSDEGIVFGDSPMVVNCRYEIRVDEAKEVKGCYMWMYTGVVTDTPESIDFPDTCDGIHMEWECAVVVGFEGIKDRGKREMYSDASAKMEDLPEGSRLGVLVDDEHDLHLYINGEDMGVVAANMPDPCYPFFELIYLYKKMTALPVTNMKE